MTKGHIKATETTPTKIKRNTRNIATIKNGWKLHPYQY